MSRRAAAVVVAEPSWARNSRRLTGSPARMTVFLWLKRSCPAARSSPGKSAEPKSGVDQREAEALGPLGPHQRLGHHHDLGAGRALLRR